MTVEQQIDTFVQVIQCATTQKNVINLSGRPIVRTSFEAYYNAIASRLELSLSLTNTPTNCENININEFAFGKRKNSANKGRNSNEGGAKKNRRKGDLN